MLLLGSMANDFPELVKLLYIAGFLFIAGVSISCHILKFEKFNDYIS